MECHHFQQTGALVVTHAKLLQTSTSKAFDSNDNVSPLLAPGEKKISKAARYDLPPPRTGNGAPCICQPTHLSAQCHPIAHWPITVWCKIFVHLLVQNFRTPWLGNTAWCKIFVHLESLSYSTELRIPVTGGSHEPFQVARTQGQPLQHASTPHSDNEQGS